MSGERGRVTSRLRTAGRYVPTGARGGGVTSLRPTPFSGPLANIFPFHLTKRSPPRTGRPRTYRPVRSRKLSYPLPVSGQLVGTRRPVGSRGVTSSPPLSGHRVEAAGEASCGQLVGTRGPVRFAIGNFTVQLRPSSASEGHPAATRLLDGVAYSWLKQARSVITLSVSAVATLSGGRSYAQR